MGDSAPRVIDIGQANWFLLPERQDSRPEFGNGKLHEATLVIDLLDQLQQLAGGATGSVGRDLVRGVWQGIEDTSLRIEVAMPAEKTPELIAMLARIAKPFGQECIYTVLGGDAKLIYRSEP